MTPTSPRHDDRASAGQHGSAALEVLMLLPFILLIFMLMFNMGYNAERKRSTQAALRLGGFSYVSGLATMNAQQSEQSAEGIVNQQLFPGETNAADLYFSTSKDKPAGFNDDQGLLGDVSSRITLGVDVTRSAPYPDLVNNNKLQSKFIVSSNTWTYCEMKDDDFGGGLDVLSGLDLVGGYALWLFGGCGGGTFKGCHDNCP
jgi:hypothetical protein